MGSNENVSLFGDLRLRGYNFRLGIGMPVFECFSRICRGEFASVETWLLGRDA